MPPPPPAWKLPPPPGGGGSFFKNSIPNSIPWRPFYRLSLEDQCHHEADETSPGSFQRQVAFRCPFFKAALTRPWVQGP